MSSTDSEVMHFISVLSGHLPFLTAFLTTQSEINQYLCLHLGQNKDFKCLNSSECKLKSSPIYQVFLSSVLFPPLKKNSLESSHYKYIFLFLNLHSVQFIFLGGCTVSTKSLDKCLGLCNGQNNHRVLADKQASSCCHFGSTPPFLPSVPDER